MNEIDVLGWLQGYNKAKAMQIFYNDMLTHSNLKTDVRVKWSYDNEKNFW